MELKPGYKQTEVGVIPEDWEVKRLGEVCSKVTDGTHDTPIPVSTGIPFLTAIHIRENCINYDGCSYVTLEDHRSIFARCNPELGDVLMVNIGAGVATTACVDVDYEFSLKNVALLKPNKAFLIGQYLNYGLMRLKAPITHALLSGGAQPFLSLAQIGQIPIPLPPLPEQKAITEALSDMDSLLSGLDSLIAKKRDIKQATMQQLLTGKTRLPGFSGEWEEKRLGEVFSITTGLSKSSYVEADGDFVVCDMGSVSTDGQLIVSKKTNHGVDFLMRGDLVMPKDDIGGGNIIGRVGYINADKKYVLGDHVYCLRTAVGDPKYLAYAINSKQVNSDLRRKVTGSAQLGLGRKSVVEQPIPFPPLPEQQAIAKVLTDMDEELAALEQRRDKTRELKQAMMQELLTGRTRLV